MIRAALEPDHESADEGVHTSIRSSPPLEDEATPEVEQQNTPDVTKYTNITNTRASPFDSGSEDHLCPVCGADILREYVKQMKKSGQSAAHEAFERFLEQHVSACLVAFDFNLDHQRLASPPDLRSIRNRMLVYNMPPIPRPSYEEIATPSGPQLSSEIYGLLVASAGSVHHEKSATVDECVICLEDLNPGDKVGRLECLCVFHYRCIKDWFNKKGFGECPVHYLHR